MNPFIDYSKRDNDLYALKDNEKVRWLIYYKEVVLKKGYNQIKAKYELTYK